MRSEAERQADDIVIATGNAVDELCSESLNGIRTGLIHRLSGRHIRAQLGFTGVLHPDLRDNGVTLEACVLTEGNGGDDLVTHSTQVAQHLQRMLTVTRFSQDEAGDRNHCVRAKYDRARITTRPGRCLVPSQRQGVRSGDLARVRRPFNHLFRIDCECNVEASQQF